MATLTAPIRIAIADDHRIFRESLRTLLENQDDLTVVGEAGDGRAAATLTAQLKPDILLLDVAMSPVSGLEVVKEISRASPGTRILLLTAAIEKGEVVEALQRGARGLVLKESATALLLKAVHALMNDQYWIDRENISDLLHALRSLATKAAETPKDFGLTPRELQIVSAIVAACSNKEIAQKFAISEKTVKHHLTNIFDKVGVSNRVELALFALHHGLGRKDVQA